LSDTIVSSSASATKVTELFNAIDALLTGDKFALANRWARVYTKNGNITETVDGVTTTISVVDSAQMSEVIYMGVGDGADKIYIGMRIIMSAIDATWGTLEFNGYAGFDADLNSWTDQPGAISKFPLNTGLPSYPIANNTTFTYWITATTKRFIVVTKLATQYMTGYFGFFTPVAVEKQFPYPLVLAGTTYDNTVSWDSGNVSSVTDPISAGYNAGGSFSTTIPSVTSASLKTSMRYRKVDGTWGAGYNNNGASKFGELNVWPTNTESTELYTCYNSIDSGVTKDSHLLIDFFLSSNYPQNLLGKLDGIFWIGGAKDIASENVVTINDTDYIIFANILARGGNDYYAVEWA